MMANSNQNNKRFRPLSDESDGEQSFAPVFVTIRSTDENKKISDISPFVIEKVVNGNIGSPKTTKTLRNGSLLLELTKEVHLQNAMKMKTFFEIPIVVEKHQKLNSVKAVFKCPELKNDTEEEICNQLKNQKVTHVKRIKIKGEPTNTFVITIESSKVPSSIKVAWMNIPLSVYIPNPLRCFKCQKYGHHISRCRASKPSCGKCAQEHLTEDCTSGGKFQCANCGEEHQAYSRSCLVWQREREILRVKYTQDVSFPDARKLVQSSTLQKSFSSVVGSAQPKPKRNVVDKSVQTITKTELVGTGRHMKPRVKSTSKADHWWNLGPLVEYSSDRNHELCQLKEKLRLLENKNKHSKTQQTSNKQTNKEQMEVVEVEVHNRFQSLSDSDISEMSESESDIKQAKPFRASPVRAPTGKK